MNRVLFLTLYIVGIVAIWLTGNPWSRVNFIILNPGNPGAALTGGFFASLLVPFLLIGIAAWRGQSISRPRLFLWPVVAVLVSALAFVYGWLSRALAGGSPTAAGFMPVSFAIALGAVSGLAPLAFHIVCCVQGASAPKGQRAGGRSAA